MIESTFGDSHPGSGHLLELVEEARQGIAKAGGHGARYFTTDICDGGINEKNLKSYLSCDKIIACGGSWMVKGELIKAGQFDKTKELAVGAVALADIITIQ